MRWDLNDPDSVMKAVISTSTAASLLIGGTSTSGDFVGGVIDRFTYARRYRGALVTVGADLTIASSAILTLSLGFQDSAASSGPFVDLPGTTSTGRKLHSVGNLTSSDAAPSLAAFQAGVNLSGARRFIRTVINISGIAGATSSGQTLASRGDVVHFIGPDEYPPDRFPSSLSSQAAT
jgi:hypothetical protein